MLRHLHPRDQREFYRRLVVAVAAHASLKYARGGGAVPLVRGITGLEGFACAVGAQRAGITHEFGRFYLFGGGVGGVDERGVFGAEANEFRGHGPIIGGSLGCSHAVGC